MSDSSISRRQFVQRTAVGLSALGAAGLLEACGSNGSSSGSSAFAGAKPPSHPVGVFRRSYSLEIDTLDPATSLAGGLLFIPSIYEGLVRYNDAWDQLLPALATEWKSSPDAREWEFTLRPGVTFHDGEPFDADAIKATFEYFTAQKNLAATLLPEFDTVDTSDPHKIRFVLKTPAGDFLRNQTFLKVMSPKLIKAGSKAIEQAPSGTGPFKLANRSPGRSVTLAANPGYWGQGPYFERLEWLLVPDATARLAALRSGQIDQTNDVSPDVLAQFSANKSFEVLSNQKPFRIDYVRFVVTNPNVADKRIRQAVAYAIDRRTIVQRLLEGKSNVATSVVPEGVYGHVDAQPQYGYDPARARALLKAAGVSNPPIRMVVFPDGGGVRVADAAQAIVGYLKDVGFNATLDIKDSSVVVREQAKPQPKWDLIYDAHSWLTGGPVIFTIDLIQELSRFNPKRVQELNTQQAALADGPARLKVLADLQNLVQENAPYIPLWLSYPNDVEKADIQGYATPPDGITYRYAETFRAA